MSVCGLRSDGFVDCWGAISGTTKEQFTFVDSGLGLTCGITVEQSVRCWEYDPADSWAPLENERLFTHLDVGTKGFCGITVGGVVVCWGDEENPSYWVAVD